MTVWLGLPSKSRDLATSLLLGKPVVWLPARQQVEQRAFHEDPNGGNLSSKELATRGIATNDASSSSSRGECTPSSSGRTGSTLKTSDADKINAFHSEMEIVKKIGLQRAF